MISEQEARIYDRCIVRVCKLEAENARLRELIKDMRKCLIDECKRCREWGDACDLDESLRELGVEATP